MSIARDISRQSKKQIVNISSNTSNIDVDGGFSGSTLDVYLNGSKLIPNADYALNGNSGIILTQSAVSGDVIEFVIKTTSNILSIVDTSALVDEAVTFSKLSNSATEADNVQKRTAKAWVLFDGRGAISITNDYNVSTITDIALGDYGINLSSPMSGSNPAVMASSRRLVSWANGGVQVVFEHSTTSYFRVIHVENSAGVDTVFSVVAFNS